MSTKNVLKYLMLILAVTAVTQFTFAQDDAAGMDELTPASAPAPEAAGPAAPFKEVPKIEIDMPTPMLLPDPAAKVGATVISGKQINELIAKQMPLLKQQIESRMGMTLATVPADKREEVKKSMLENLGDLASRVNMFPFEILNDKIMKALIDNYVTVNKTPLDQEMYDKAMQDLDTNAKMAGKTAEELMATAGMTKKDIEDSIRFQTLVTETKSDENARKFVAAHPNYFNGTEVSASHILIQVTPIASTADQKAAIDQLKQIKADIEAKKMTFAEAANKFSKCPSGQKNDEKYGYGALQPFQFAVGNRMTMAPTFAEAAFNLKKDEISDVVRTMFGFHLIKCNDVVEGKLAENPSAVQVAKQVLEANLFNDIIGQALTDCPIEIYAKMPEPAAEEAKAAE